MADKLFFPSGESSNVESFLMTPYEFNVSTNRGSQKINRDLQTDSSIVLPTPSGGLTLNESGNWEEMEGFQQWAQGTSSQVLNKLKESIGASAEHLIKGKFVNDYASLAFKGTNFRTFSFSWNLIPRSEKDAHILVEIIKTIRKNSLPNYTSSNLVNYPAMWLVSPVTNNPIDFSLLDCVITNFSVNYTPEGILRRFNSGHPTSVNIEIEFKELYRASRSDV